MMWNCRGANKTNFRRSIRFLLKKFPTDILAIFETDAGGDKAGQICQRLGFESSYRVDAVGQSGGLWLLWKSEIGEVEIVESSDQFIHAVIVNGEERVNLVVVYAAPTASRRSGLWEPLRRVVSSVDGSVIVGGDFNTIIRLDERCGGNGRLSSDSLAFGEWINNLSLIDMGFCGNQYTWRRGKSENFLVAKRLDRVLCCPHTRLKWQEAKVSHLPFLASDHAPLYVQLSPECQGNASRRPFRFEAAWLKHPSFKDLLASSWKNDINTRAALKDLRYKLKKWNREVFGDVQVRKDKLLKVIKVTQSLVDQQPSNELLEEETLLLKELDVVLEQEEVIWFQKSREKWIDHGDRNTSFFHTSTVIRRRRNRIECLKNDTDTWVSDGQELEQIVVDYFQRLYSLDDVELNNEKLPQKGFVDLQSDHHRDLSKPFSAWEVEQAVRSMGKFKAPGPDGFQAVFYQDSWDVVGTSVTKFVLDFFRDGVLPEKTNDVLVALIPKVLKPEKITQFRPISLCNVLFKAITKTMVGRMKGVMQKLI